MGRGAARLLAAAAIATGLAACGSGAPKGVKKDVLDEAVSRAIGDPNSCVLMAEQKGGRLVYRYNTHAACDRKLPACEGPGERSAQDLLELTLKDGQARTLSCDTAADHSRGVGWASGMIAGRGLAYAAVMEGDRAFPGRMMAERLEGAFRRAGL